jgi:hypothetical protein
VMRPLCADLQGRSVTGPNLLHVEQKQGVLPSFAASRKSGPDTRAERAQLSGGMIPVPRVGDCHSIVVGRNSIAEIDPSFGLRKYRMSPDRVAQRAGLVKEGGVNCREVKKPTSITLIFLKQRQESCRRPLLI